MKFWLSFFLTLVTAMSVATQSIEYGKPLELKG